MAKVRIQIEVVDGWIGMTPESLRPNISTHSVWEEYDYAPGVAKKIIADGFVDTESGPKHTVLIPPTRVWKVRIWAGYGHVQEEGDQNA